MTAWGMEIPGYLPILPGKRPLRCQAAPRGSTGSCETPCELRHAPANLFVPGRDDAIVLHNLTGAALFICHESALEFGYRLPLSRFGAW